MPLNDVINELADYIEFRRIKGDITETIDPSVIAELAPAAPAAATAPAAPATPATAQRSSAAAVTPPGSDKRAKQPSNTATTTSPVMTPAAKNLTPEQRVSEMRVLAGRISRCTRCPLRAEQNQTVPGQGCLNCEIMFIGDLPNQEEGQRGLAFLGDAGELLTRMLKKMGYSRDHVFVTNIMKCRPAVDRIATPEEQQACLPLLKAQIALIRPKTLVALGERSAQLLTGSNNSIEQLRGSWHEFNGVPLIATHHPAELLQTPAARHETWADMQQVLVRLGRVQA